MMMLWCNPLQIGINNWYTLRTYENLLLLVYTWLWTCIRWQVCSFLPYDFLKFSKFCTITYFVKPYCYIFDLWFICLSYEETYSLLLTFILKKCYFSIFYRKYLINISSYLKACVRYFSSIFYFSLNDSLSKTMKNVFYFI